MARSTRSSVRPATPAGMTANQRRIAVYILIGLLALYIAPLLAAAGPTLFGGLHGEAGPGALLLQLMIGGGPYAQASAVMTPLIAGLTVATMWSRAYRRWAYVAIGLSAAGVLAAVILWYGLSGTAAEPIYYYAPAGYDDALAFASLKERFLGAVFGTLATVVAVLLGLRATDVGRSND